MVHRCGEEILKGELPPKHEVVLKLALTPTQQKVYERYLQVGTTALAPLLSGCFSSRQAACFGCTTICTAHPRAILPCLQGTAEREARSLFRDRGMLAMVSFGSPGIKFGAHLHALLMLATVKLFCAGTWQPFWPLGRCCVALQACGALKPRPSSAMLPGSWSPQLTSQAFCLRPTAHSCATGPLSSETC